MPPFRARYGNASERASEETILYLALAELPTLIDTQGSRTTVFYA